MGGAIHLAQIFYGSAMPEIIIREFQPQDFDVVTILWRLAREKSIPDFQRRKGHFFYEDREYFRDRILQRDQVWVAETAGQPVAFMAMENDFIDQLYVHPDHWRRGIGEALLNFAKSRYPQHLWLYTLQVNVDARAFYEKNGFVAEKFGFSDPPENEPDAQYHWRVNPGT